MVKCAECGYLGVRHIGTQELVSPSADQRATGEPPGGPERIGPAGVLDVVPVCAVGAWDLPKEFTAHNRPANENTIVRHRASAAAAKTVMQEDRRCPQVTPWLPGLTPKEHIDKNLLEHQQAWQDERSKEDARREDRRDTKNFRLNCVLVIVAVVSAVAAWWSATHPTAIPIPQPPTAAAAPTETPRPQEAKRSPPAGAPGGGKPADAAAPP
jgi:hypothetical protein